MEILLVREDLKRGDLLALNSQGDVVKYNPVPQVIGVAARPISTGEVIKLDRSDDTADILVKWNSKK